MLQRNLQIEKLVFLSLEEQCLFPNVSSLPFFLPSCCQHLAEVGMGSCPTWAMASSTQQALPDLIYLSYQYSFQGEPCICLEEIPHEVLGENQAPKTYPKAWVELLWETRRAASCLCQRKGNRETKSREWEIEKWTQGDGGR